MIMVDELQIWGIGKGFWKDRASCHLTFVAPSTVDDLHALAARIGMRREWFQAHSSAPHYDLTAGRRARALAAGATFVPGREQARARVAARRGSAA